MRAEDEPPFLGLQAHPVGRPFSFQAPEISPAAKTASAIVLLEDELQSHLDDSRLL